MKIKPQHVFALALMGAQGAWAADGANAQSSLDFFNSSLAPLSIPHAALPEDGEVACVKRRWPSSILRNLLQKS